MTQFKSKWYRVNRRHPCRVCGKPDWCTYTDDGAVCCMRRESERQLRNGGWLHRDGNFRPYIAPAIRAAIQDPPLDADAKWRRWYEATDRKHLDQFGMKLGVDTDALGAIGCAWADRAWAFPMFTADRQVIGIRLRDDDGRKWAVKGSKNGLFIPIYDDSAIEGSNTLWLVEGPTDLAAALTIGLSAIGRAACLGQEDMILRYLKVWKIKRLVIVADNDRPDQHGRLAGLAGAKQLQERVPIASAIVIPPTKDLRQFVNCGGDYVTAQAMLCGLVWTVR